MVAHSSPLSFCSLCGIAGHKENECVADPTKSVGLKSWKRLKTNLSDKYRPTHLQELSDCLGELSSYHFSLDVKMSREVSFYLKYSLYKRDHL